MSPNIERLMGLNIQGSVPEAYKLFITAVGANTISWALLEGALDMLVEVAHENPVEPEKPLTSLDRKLAYLRKFARLRLPHPIRAELLEVLHRIGQKSNERHALVHGAVMNAAEITPSGEIVLSMRDKSRAQDFIEKRINLTGIIDTSAAAVIAGWELLLLTKRLRNNSP